MNLGRVEHRFSFQVPAEIVDHATAHEFNTRYVSRDNPGYPLPSAQRAHEIPWMDTKRRDTNGKLRKDEISTIKRLIKIRMRERRRKPKPNLPTHRLYMGLYRCGPLKWDTKYWLKVLPDGEPMLVELGRGDGR